MTTTQINTSIDLPTLNVELLGDIVTWAVVDHHLIEQAEQMSGQQREVFRRISREKFTDWGHWEQGSWAVRRLDEGRNGACGSAFCMAGQAVALDPRFSILDDDESCIRLDLPDGVRAPRFLDDSLLADYGLSEDEVEEDKVSIDTAARDMLGLTGAEAGALFSGSNEIGRIIGLAEVFAEMRGVDLDLPGWVTILAEDRADTLAHLGYYSLGRAYMDAAEAL